MSGGIIEDIYVARAALEAGSFDLDDVDGTIAKMEKTEKS